MRAKKTNQYTYEDYLTVVKGVLASKSVETFPRLVVVTGPSGYLRAKTFDALRSSWLKSGWGTVQSVECSEIDQSQFVTMASQTSLFEPCSLYIFRRAAAVKNLHSWLSQMGSKAAIRSYLVLDVGEKISSDLQKQFTRLNALIVPCFEPVGQLHFRKVAASLAKRYRLDLSDEAITAILDTTGYDLVKIENEISKLGLQFLEANRQLGRADVVGSLGALREDDVFELFRLLGGRRWSHAQVMVQGLLGRGESALAIVGIFARYAREQIEKGSVVSGLAGLRACAEADRRLKTSPADELLVLSGVIEHLVGV